MFTPKQLLGHACNLYSCIFAHNICNNTDIKKTHIKYNYMSDFIITNII